MISMCQGGKKQVDSRAASCNDKLAAGCSAAVGAASTTDNTIQPRGATREETTVEADTATTRTENEALSLRCCGCRAASQAKECCIHTDTAHHISI
jgi:hypothetical protein